MRTLFLSALLTAGLGGGFVRADIIWVTSANDTGDNSNPGVGTLRAAIINANNASSVPSLIKFKISPGGVVQVIHVLTQLPTITQPVVIDGTTQPGYAGTPLVEIKGDSAPFPTEGLVIQTNGCGIYGLALNSFPSIIGFVAAAVHVVDGGGVIIRNNYLGLTASGSDPALLELAGLHIENSGGCEVGGPGFGGNVISDNAQYGVWISGFQATNNVVEGNYIGTDITGVRAKGNGYGVMIAYAGLNQVGGPAAASCNVISGNSSNGVFILAGCSNLVQNNDIGTGLGGIGAVPNGVGILIASAPESDCVGNEVIGNVISANSGGGISLTPTNLPAGFVRNNLVSNNLIGVDINGAALGNRGDGIAMLSSCTMQNVAVTNVIANNLHDGVRLSGMNDFIGWSCIRSNGHNGLTVITNDGTGLEECIRSNSIYANGALGIDLGDDGVTPNDRLDPDLGANNLQNFPVVTNALHSWGFVTVSGYLDSKTHTNYALDFFWNVCKIVCPCNCERGGYYIGSLVVTTDGRGYAYFNTTFAAQVPTGLGPNPAYIEATATDPDGNTSEFSDCCMVTELFTAQVVGPNIVVSWANSDCTLQSSPQLSPPSWSNVTAPITCEEGECHVSLPMTANAMFFRLSCP